jgi:hypothetical protein
LVALIRQVEAINGLDIIVCDVNLFNGLAISRVKQAFTFTGAAEPGHLENFHDD